MGIAERKGHRIPCRSSSSRGPASPSSARLWSGRRFARDRPSAAGLVVLIAFEQGDFGFDGTLRAEFALGSRTQYAVDVPGGEVTVEKLRESRPSLRSGDSVRLGWDLEHSHLMAEG